MASVKMIINFKIGEPTVNGHIYGQDLIIQLQEKIEFRRLSVLDESGGIIGVATNCNVNENGDIAVDITFGKDSDEIFGTISTSGHGIIDENGFVKNYTLQNLLLIPN